MTSQTIKIRNGVISLPKGLRKNWEMAEVFISGGEDAILIKKVRDPSFFQMLDEFRKIGKKLRKKDVENAIGWARRKEFKK
ncbi:MAG: hypothetical protein HQ536_02640 [Parcubacteria group bacterium]|nr:hypothetical protein [Parcubacteria group bacterium]